MATALPFPHLTRRTCLSVLLGAGAAPGVLALSPPVAPTPPPPRRGPLLQTRGAERPVRLAALALRTEVAGHAVLHRLELVFHNPNARVLEGELQFPLQAGQWVSGFELDIDGELRPAVPVDKALGQQVFEEVTRARVDPALLEVTEGDNYKLRVYPLPPHGERRVVLQIAQTLDRHGQLALPIGLADHVERLDLQVQVAGVAAGDIGIEASGFETEAVTRTDAPGGWAHVALSLAGVEATPALQLRLPPRRDPLVTTQRHAGREHFYAELPLALRSAPRQRPRRITLLWDASGSGARRDHAREFALIDAYLRTLGQVEVTLRVGRDTVEPPRRYAVRHGHWDALRRTLEGLAYDGATNLPGLLAGRAGDLALLFCDGLSNWGATAAPSPADVPLYAVADARGAHVARLRKLAERSGGAWLDLGIATPAEAVQALHTRQARLVRLSSLQARELVAASPYVEAGHIVFAGVLGQPQAEVTLEFELPDGRLERHLVQVGAQSVAGTQAAQRWAQLRVAELGADLGAEAHRAEIRRIGRRHGLVTTDTSLIVLDALADYVRHEIEPPASMRAAYARALAQQVQRQAESRAQHLDRVAARFAEHVRWWAHEFPKDTPPQAGQEREAQASASGALGQRERAAVAAPRAAVPVQAGAAPAPALMTPAPALMAPAPAERSRLARADAAAGKSARDVQAAPAAASIRLAPWAPDAPHARRLRAAPAASVYQHYLDERPDHLQSTAFFLDAADVLFSRQQPALAMRVLSNLAEMDLQNRHILRVLGYRLLQARAPQLAIPVLREVLRLAPHEPQSHRDLGLAHAEAGEWQAAADQLWEVVARPWGTRFPDIDLTALAELNMVIARARHCGRPVDTRAFDNRLLRALPLDLRITLAWDADNTDIDLWVTDPNGERVHYGHRLSYQGGRNSRDVTGGYGPEEFALRVAKPGRYLVQAQFYGHRQQIVSPATTLMLRLTTGFGRVDQKEELVTLRLSGPAEVVTVGSFEVGGG